MNASLIVNYALAKVMLGADSLAKKRDIDGLYALLNCLTDQDIVPVGLEGDLFEHYHSQSDDRSKKVVDGLEALHVGQKVQAVEMVAEGAKTGLQSLITSMQILKYSDTFDSDTQRALRLLQDVSQDDIFDFRPRLMIKFLEATPALSRNAKKAVKKKIKNALVPGFIEKEKLSEQSQLRLAFAAFVEDMIFKYDMIPYFEKQQDCYGFSRSFSQLGNEDAFDSFEVLAACRVPKLYFAPRRVIDAFVESVSKDGRIAVGNEHLSHLTIYPFAPSLSELNKMIDKAEKRKDKSVDWNERGMQMFKQFEPKLYKRNHFVSGLVLFPWRDFVSRLNELALYHCENIDGEISLKEASTLLGEHFRIRNYDESKIKKVLT